MSDSSVVPTVQALLSRLEERDALIVHLKSEIDTLKAKVAALEVRLGKNSQNSSKPPSTHAFVKPPAEVPVPALWPGTGQAVRGYAWNLPKPPTKCSSTNPTPAIGAGWT